MTISANVSGTWREAAMSVRDAGVWKAVQTGFVRDAGVWKPFYSAVPTVPGTPWQGGFYVGRITMDDGIYALVVADIAAETTLQWATSAFNTPGTDSTYDGLANSNAMNAAGFPAAQYCRAYNGGGFTDWFMPAKDQLEMAYRYLKPGTANNTTASGANSRSIPTTSNYTTTVPGQTTSAAFITGGGQAFSLANYWASTQSSSSGNAQSFNNGAQTTFQKTSTNRVRPMRQIKLT